MNQRFVFYSVGKLLQVLAMVLFVPTAIALWETDLQGTLLSFLFDKKIIGFLIAIVASFACGILFIFFSRGRKTTGGVREGFAIVTFAWLLFSLFGCIPLFAYFLAEQSSLSPMILVRAFTDAYFEIMSGFTTTGATILTDIEVLPKGILFWRSLTHWLGGMGIVTLALIMLPAFGVAAYQMFRGEVPGPSTERLTPRVAQTASVLWAVYAVLTLAETLLLWIGGMTVFDAFCHAFGTLATGGFSTRNASIGAYDSQFIDWVITIFMFFAGVNFIIHYQVIFRRGLGMVKSDSEFHFYVIVMLVATVLTTAVLAVVGLGSVQQIGASFRNAPLAPGQLLDKIAEERYHLRSLYQTLRYAAFQVISITTTTGYVTTDFDTWPNFLRLTLVVLMFFGGSAGSTGGGMKMIRVMVVLKTAWREVRTMIQPRLILPVKVGGNALEEKQVANILGFAMLFLLLFVFFSAVMSTMIPDFTTAITTVVATMCNIGPGLSGIGAYENYAWIPIGGKWVLVLCMLLGRLEIYTVLIAFAPISWKK